MLLIWTRKKKKLLEKLELTTSAQLRANQLATGTLEQDVADHHILY